MRSCSPFPTVPELGKIVEVAPAILWIDPILVQPRLLSTQLGVSPITVGLAFGALFPFFRAVCVTGHHDGGSRAGTWEYYVSCEAILGGLGCLDQLAVTHELIAQAAVPVRKGRGNGLDSPDCGSTRRGENQIIPSVGMIDALTTSWPGLSRPSTSLFRLEK